VADKELAPVANIVTGNYVVYAVGSIGAGSLRELVAWAKANPGKLRAASATSGNHMLMAMVAKQVGFQFENIPYKTTGQVITALLADESQVTINAIAAMVPHLASGKIRGIALLGEKRTTLQPQIPTAKEQGFPMIADFDVGLWGPLGMPRDIVMRINSIVGESLKDPALQERMQKLSYDVSPMSPEEMVKSYQRQMAFFTEAADLVGFKAE
jgi:tripartite-type tricarboxylate transporter receptor subunit TctC